MISLSFLSYMTWMKTNKWASHSLLLSANNGDDTQVDDDDDDLLEWIKGKIFRRKRQRKEKAKKKNDLNHYVEKKIYEKYVKSKRDGIKWCNGKESMEWWVIEEHFSLENSRLELFWLRHLSDLFIGLPAFFSI